MLILGMKLSRGSCVERDEMGRSPPCHCIVGYRTGGVLDKKNYGAQKVIVVVPHPSCNIMMAVITTSYNHHAGVQNLNKNI
jgi:hypothetical protein